MMRSYNSYFMNMDSSKFKHYQDERSSDEVQLSDLLMDTISDYNIELHQQQYLCTHANKDLLTIVITGIPANKHEFEGYVFTKRLVTYFPPCCEVNQTEEFYAKRMYDANINTVVREIDDIVVANGNRVIFVCHSGGCFFSTAYIHRHPKKVIGIIEIGGIPVTFNASMRWLIEHFIVGNEDKSLEDRMKNAEAIHQKYLSFLRQYAPKNNNPMGKYTLLAYISMLNTEVFQEMFDWRRKLPNILKLIIYGRWDGVVEKFLNSEMSFYFTYGKGSLSDDYNKLMCKKYKTLTNFETINVQERFVYSFPKTGHGVHMIRKEPLQNLVNLYLALVLSNQPEAASL